MKKFKILIVENNALIAHNIAASLLDSNFAIAGIVDNGEEAISKAMDLAPDLILLDIDINGKMDGIDVADKLNKNSPLPIIFLTAFSDLDTIKRIRKTHPYTYLVKPFDQRQLIVNATLAIENFSRFNSGFKRPNSTEQENTPRQNEE